MIKSVQLGKEIVITITNKIGILADVSRILADHGINIEAVAGYAVNNEAKIMVVTGDNLRAVDALKKAGYGQVKENEVLVVDLENKVGALKNFSVKLAEEAIDIKQIYGTVSGSDSPAKMIVSTADNEKALVALKK